MMELTLLKVNELPSTGDQLVISVTVNGDMRLIPVVIGGQLVDSTWKSDDFRVESRTAYNFRATVDPAFVDIVGATIVVQFIDRAWGYEITTI
jgi:hypothetical protein